MMRDDDDSVYVCMCRYHSLPAIPAPRISSHHWQVDPLKGLGAGMGQKKSSWWRNELPDWRIWHFESRSYVARILCQDFGSKCYETKSKRTTAITQACRLSPTHRVSLCWMAKKADSRRAYSVCATTLDHDSWITGKGSSALFQMTDGSIWRNINVWYGVTLFVPGIEFFLWSLPFVAVCVCAEG